ncbi:MAG TPA: hypothetical protein VGM88_33790 [Kofleriaceae bacterium]|jgi:hypothetical protein
MPQLQFGGPIGPFFDNVQRRGVPCTVNGVLDYQPMQPADPAQLEPWLRNQLLGAVNAVISHKMSTGALQFRNLGEGQLLGAEQEIVQQSGIVPAGMQVNALQLSFGIDNHPPQQHQRPPEVRANIRVGGINIKASSTGGVDTAHLKNQIANRVKSTLIWYAVFGILTLLIVGGVIWYVLHTVHKAVDQSNASPAAVAAKTWDGTSPLVCGGADDIKVDGVTAKLDGTVIQAGGGCKLTLTNCNLTGTDAIDAAGGAVITVTGGSLTGSGFAVKALGNAKITLSGTKVTGKTQKLGAATITGP